MFTANQNLDDSNNAEISAELEALLSHGHMSHESPFEGECTLGWETGSVSSELLEVDNRSADHYLFGGNEEEALLDEDSLPFDIELDPHHDGTIEDNGVNSNGADEEHFRPEEMTGEHGVDIRRSSNDEMGGEDVFYVEKRSPANSASGSMYASPHGTAVTNTIHMNDKSFDEKTFEIAVEDLEMDGHYLPESTHNDVEIATEHLHLAEDVARFGTPTIVDNSHERLIDDETLDRLKEEMKRMDQERNHVVKNPTHNASTQHSNMLAPFPTLSSPRHHQQNAFAGPSTYQNSQPGPSIGRNGSLRSMNLTGSPSIGSFLDSDASPQSEASAPPQQKPPRRRLTDERRDSGGSSSSRHLIPLCEETGKRMMMKDRMDQLAVSEVAKASLLKTDAFAFT
jgi:hypothetical protein